MDTTKFQMWVNTQITEKSVADKLMAMCEADSRSRSDFIRLLIVREFDRRNAAVSSAPIKKVVTRKASKATH